MFLDPSLTLSFMTPYMANKFEILLESLVELFNVSIHLGESILVKRVYSDYTISIYRKDTIADLVELDIVNFDVILGID